MPSNRDSIRLRDPFGKASVINYFVSAELLSMRAHWAQASLLITRSVTSSETAKLFQKLQPITAQPPVLRRWSPPGQRCKRLAERVKPRVILRVPAKLAGLAPIALWSRDRACSASGVGSSAIVIAPIKKPAKRGIWLPQRHKRASRSVSFLVGSRQARDRPPIGVDGFLRRSIGVVDIGHGWEASARAARQACSRRYRATERPRPGQAAAGIRAASEFAACRGHFRMRWPRHAARRPLVQASVGCCCVARTRIALSTASAKRLPL